jgi:hypothetical protein
MIVAVALWATRARLTETRLQRAAQDESMKTSKRKIRRNRKS